MDNGQSWDVLDLKDIIGISIIRRLQSSAFLALRKRDESLNCIVVKDVAMILVRVLVHDLSCVIAMLLCPDLFILKLMRLPCRDKNTFLYAVL